MNVVLVLTVWAAFALIVLYQPGDFRAWRARLRRNRAAAAYREAQRLQRDGGRIPS